MPNARLNQSFDEEVLREMYDDFGVASDFNSELSWISYPPNQGTLVDYYENNPRKQAENDLFQQKIKMKFHFNNMYRESYDPPPPPEEPVAQMTQTMAEDFMKVPDPFETSSEESFTSSEALSCIDFFYCEKIMKKATQGVSSDDYSDLRSQEQEVVIRESRKRRRQAPA